MTTLLSRFRIGTKIAGTVLTVLALTVVIAWLALTSLGQLNDRLTHIVDVSDEKVRLAANLHRNLVEVSRAEKNFLLATTAAERDQYVATTDQLFVEIEDRQSRLVELADAKGLALFNEFDENWRGYLEIAEQVRDLVSAGDIERATALSMGDARIQMDVAASKLEAIVAKNDADMDLDKQLSAADFVRARNLLIGCSLLAVVVGLALGLTVSWAITTSLQAMVRVAGEIADGVVTEKVAVVSRDETGELAAAFNRSIDYLQEMAGVAGRIAGGDLATDFSYRSQRDTLGIALHHMMLELRRITAENELRVWQATGQSELNDRMRGELSMVDLAQNVINYLCHYLDAQIGALYVNENDHLKLVGSYAYTRRKGLSDQFRIGEGLVGQAALERQPIVISEIPDDYIRIQSGLGESPPHHIVVVPFVYEDRVGGVIELGRFGEWTDAQMSFLKLLTESVAISCQVSLARTRMMELLEKTQRQAEELQVQTEELEAQQEELRQTNEELKQQTHALEESAEELQTQQEELKATNEELTEKTWLLEQQRTEVEEQNRTLQRAQKELESRAQDLALASRYKSEFLSNMSHELRTPLNSMLILAHMLADNEEGNLTEEQVESAQVVYESGQDLLALINDILDLAKVESGRMDRHLESVDPAHLLSEVGRSFAPVAKEKGLEFQTHLEAGLPELIYTDRKRVEQILKNLLSNAFKFTADGSVTVTIHRPEADRRLLRSDLDPSRVVAISVTDTGIGISEKHQQTIFEAFQQVDGSISREYGGTGLGLSISREMAAFLEGEIGLQSTVGQGSTFTLYLPETIAEGGPPPLEAGPVSSPAEETLPSEGAVSVVTVADDREGLTEGDRLLLVIEDDPRFAKVLRGFAHDRDFKVLVAHDGESGLHLARQHKPMAIVLDLKLPRISGWDVLAQIKDDPDTRHIPVHIISGEDETLTAFQRGAIGYLTKPVDSTELDQAFESIQSFLARRVRTLLIVDDDLGTRKTLRKLIGNGDVECLDANSAQEALNVLQTRPVDCMILDLRLPDMSGFDLLDRLEANGDIHKPPVIVYTGKELTREENDHLIRYADTVIVKGIKSEERLLDETSLFLHRVVSALPAGKQRIIRQLHDLEAAFEQKKILLVDDDVRNAFALSRLLSEKGLDVEIATDGQKALDILVARPDTDLVLMDVMLPVVDGLEVIRRIRAQRKFANLPILAVTAKAMRGDREECLAAGANDYLPKPVDVDRLLSLLRVWLYR